MPESTDNPTEVFPEATIDELADAVRPADAPADAWRDEALEAIAQLSEPQHEVRPSLMLTLVSMLLFYLTLGFFIVGDWTLTPFIVLIVLIHEMGHYIAMKAFGYRELQMIFVPFFGAAVMGRKPEATQAQRAIVALSGPAPGLLLAAGFVIAVSKHWIDAPPVLGERILLMTVLLNGFNLMPIEPLDGGHFFNALFYSRHPWIETVCKVFSAAIFGYLAVTMSLIFAVIAAVIVMSLRIKHSISLLSRRLRAAGLNTDPSLDDMSIERLLKAYVLARDLAPQNPAASLEFNVRYRTGLLQRAYPGALARPALPALVTALLLCYLLVAGAGLNAWRGYKELRVENAQREELNKQLEQQKLQSENGDETSDEGTSVRIFKRTSDK